MKKETFSLISTSDDACMNVHFFSMKLLSPMSRTYRQKCSFRILCRFKICISPFPTLV